jgi:hypothetical protein
MKVSSKIHEYLNIGFSKKGKVSVSLRIQLALAEVTNKREELGANLNPALRDAEYYLHGLYSTASGDIEHTIATNAVPMYVALKYAAHAAKDMGLNWLEKLMRTDPDKDTSEPGGLLWAYRGLYDGTSVDGKVKVNSGKSHSLNLSIINVAETPPLLPPIPITPKGFRIRPS